MNPDPITPATRGGDLPATPLTRADKPRDAPKTKYGRLVRSVGAKGRPFVSLLVGCPKCRKPHFYAWRHDWLLATDIRSFQTSRCPHDQRPQWLGLDGATLPDSVATHAEARETYLAWEQERARRRAEREIAGTPPQPIAPETVDEPAEPPQPAIDPPQSAPAPASPASSSSAPLGRRLRRSTAAESPPGSRPSSK